MDTAWSAKVRARLDDLHGAPHISRVAAIRDSLR